MAEAFRRFAGIDLLATMDAAGRTDRAALAAAVRAAGGRVADDDSWADLFSRVLVERVEPHLGDGRATVLCEYPVAEAALARPKPGDPRVAERFELYACGVELANGFGELTDPVEQRRRFEADMDLKERLYGERYPAGRGLPRRARPHAAGERHRARLRPPGDAGHRRADDRARAVGAGAAQRHARERLTAPANRSRQATAFGARG